MNATRLVLSTKVLLKQMRLDEGWEEFILPVIKCYVDHGIDILDMKEIYMLHGGHASTWSFN